MSGIIFRQLKRAGRLWSRSLVAGYAFYKSSLDSWKIFRRPGFGDLLGKASKHCILDSDDVLPYISQEGRDDRIWSNLKLAEAYSAAGNYTQAKVFIQRVWAFSGLDERYLDLFIRINVACDDIDAIRAAHKALGMKKAGAGKIAQALQQFNAWQYAFATHRNEDDYQYDFEVLDRIKQLSEPFAFRPRTLQTLRARRIRLAYLVYGITQPNSVIVKISALFAKYHDSSQFDVRFYVPESSATLGNLPQSKENILQIERFGGRVLAAPNVLVREDSLIGLSRVIHDWQPDILITTAGLADFEHYFVSSLKPAPITIGLCQGPPPQFIAPDFDWSISWFKSLLIDCPVDCSLVPLRLDLPVRVHTREAAKSDLGIGSKAQVIMTSGRYFKLQDEAFLQSLADLIGEHSDAWLVVVGIDKLPTTIANSLTPEIASRIVLLGWVREFHKALSAADIVVDTYPSGGGVVIKDAMSLGTPVVSFKNDYLKQFSQKECSAAEEVIGMPELLLERGDFLSLKRMVSRLLTDQAYRADLSQRCIARIHETSGQPERMVKECEQVYLQVLKSKAGN